MPDETIGKGWSRRIFADERAVLRCSILLTVCVSAAGIGFGLLSHSFSILFDGVYALFDGTMSLLALGVAGLIARQGSGTLPDRFQRRFNFGVWHLEPMVLALNGCILVAVSGYAFVNAVLILLQGGRALEFGFAMAYAALTTLACGAMAIAETRANRRIRSEFVALDARGWMMSAGISAALLIAFAVGKGIEDTGLAWATAYVDPAVLALVCLVILPLPVPTVRRALSDVLLMAPPDLQRAVDAVAAETVSAHGFLDYRAYVARLGRARQIEIYFIVPPDVPGRSISEWDAIRDQVGDAIGGAEQDRWLTIVFTADMAWAD